MNYSGCFSPTLGFHLISCVLVCDYVICFTIPGYCLYGSDTQINDQHLKNKLNYKSASYTRVSLTVVAYICRFHYLK